MYKRKALSVSGNGTTRLNVKPNGTSVRSFTLSWNEIPEWQRDNEYILSGYRP
ncbi:hypothetical protein JVU11DRAFT_5734 [Chiua virens]|nr:hypothetical protein JVU11DRAFT_5734 [Chiua virens]